MIWKLEGVYEVESRWATGEGLIFRLEIFSNQNQHQAPVFKARQLRYDIFKVNPAFETDPEFESAIHQWAIVHVDLDPAPPDVITLEQAVAWYVKKLKSELD